MKLKLGETIKQLRRERDLTQEELATVLGVSYQSVSRWENGACYPDLELLPTIADYFVVSVDRLLGLEETAEQEAVGSYLDRFQQAISKGHIDDCITIARAGVAEYPNNYTLLNKLMYALFASGDEDGNIPNWRENMARYDAEIVSLGKRIMKYCPDLDIRQEAMCRLAFHYAETDRRQEAKEIIQALPSQWYSRERWMSLCAPQEERLGCFQELCRASLFGLCKGLHHIADERLLPDEDTIQVYETLITLKTLIAGPAPDNHAYGDARQYCKLAAVYARLGQTANVFAQLRIAAAEAKRWDDRPESGANHSMLLGDEVWSHSDWDTADTRTCQEILRDKWMAVPEFDALRDTPEFQEILSTLA